MWCSIFSRIGWESKLGIHGLEPIRVGHGSVYFEFTVKIYCFVNSTLNTFRNDFALHVVKNYTTPKLRFSIGRNPMELVSNNFQNGVNKNLEHCSLSKVKQFDSGQILGENRKS